MSSFNDQQSDVDERGHQREQLWLNFFNELDNLKSRKDLGITDVDIANGLKISRGTLNSFRSKLKNSKKHDFSKDSLLQIDRIHILQLWDHLTKPPVEEGEVYSVKQLKRIALREDLLTLNNLLKSAGFLPESSDADPQIERVKQRLDSYWVRNSPSLSLIVTRIIDIITDFGGQGNQRRRQELSEPYSVEKFEDWLRKNIVNFNERSKQGFVKQITRFLNLGKSRFSDFELFELYQSISENEDLGKFDIPTITDCQFRTLSFSLLKEFEATKELQEKIATICLEGEKDLRTSNTSDQPDRTLKDLLKVPPVIEATVIFTRKEESKKLKDTPFCYASSTTHIENMLLALSHGLGVVLKRHLELTGFSIRAIGKSSDSLARVSVSLTEVENLGMSMTYHGIWVEHNTILGILQSVLFAAISWLSEKHKTRNLGEFYAYIEEVSSVRNELYEDMHRAYNHSYDCNSIPAIYDGQTRESENIDARLQRTYERIEGLSASLDTHLASIPDRLSTIDRFYDGCKEDIRKFRLLCKLASMHVSLVGANSLEANNRCREIEDEIEKCELSGGQHSVLLVLYASELMFFRFITGDYSFFNQKQWRRELFKAPFTWEVARDHLKNYVAKFNSNIADLDAYISASQFLGIKGLIEFYACSHEEDKPFLDDAFEYLITAAYYSSRVGHKQRTARMLCYASRVCCRLNDQDSAEHLAEVAKRILSETRAERQQASESLLQLTNAEIILHFNSNRDDLVNALEGLLDSWKRCTGTELNGTCLSGRGMSRTGLESLYNICRLFNKPEISELFEANRPIPVIKNLFQGKTEAQSNMEEFIRTNALNDSDTCNVLVTKLLRKVELDLSTTCIPEHNIHPLSQKIQDFTFLGKL